MSPMARHESMTLPREALSLDVTMHPPFAGDPGASGLLGGSRQSTLRMKPSRVVRFVSRGRGKRVRAVRRGMTGPPQRPEFAVTDRPRRFHTRFANNSAAA